MKITVDWDVLQREHIPIGDFLVPLMGCGFRKVTSGYVFMRRTVLDWWYFI